MSLYLISAHGEGSEHARLREQWARTGKKLDMGKCCIRFKKTEDLALDVIGEAIGRTPAKVYIAHYEQALKGASRRATAGAPAKKPGAKKAAAKGPEAKKAAAKKA
jgi:hypothetical protein